MENIDYNSIWYLTANNRVWLCPMEKREEITNKTSILLFCLMDLSNREYDWAMELYKTDKKEFALTVQDYIDMYPHFVMN
jgi:hypothetical protein